MWFSFASRNLFNGWWNVTTPRYIHFIVKCKLNRTDIMSNFEKKLSKCLFAAIFPINKFICNIS